MLNSHPILTATFYARIGAHSRIGEQAKIQTKIKTKGEKIFEFAINFISPLDLFFVIYLIEELGV